MRKPAHQISRDSGTRFSETREDSLADLITIDRLIVGPAVVEKNRVKTPYRVVRGGAETSTELIYRYEEPVFNPGEPESHNLANMITAQVALNYGLFARTIEFRGSFDESDMRFLRAMAENTAREIYVKKFLEYNPYIVSGSPVLPALKRESYLQAELSFPDGAAKRLHPWSVSKDRYAILSSGGKDSLLSYGLLNEIGSETHQIFLNESGRHWFTALNSYRYFRDNVRNTSRVWLNSDRVFAWMLQHFPFIRKDFATLRADDYPIRLWTVAVFLFGALPLMRKRGIGRLIIGDEYDTTRRASHKGIPHYDGLYDQSIFFDRALSRYFERKGWSLTQLSILRPLSELLIEKMLSERYPELQDHQMSCHMTHKDGDRIFPCGQCEKCHRIVGMLLAIDRDPSGCGYNPGQVERIKKTLCVRHMHQEAAGVNQILTMLLQKGKIKPQNGKMKNIRPHPEVLQVRFDPQNAPVDCIPKEIREPLFRLFIAHSEGAVRRNGRRWLPCDPLSDPDFQ